MKQEERNLLLGNWKEEKRCTSCVWVSRKKAVTVFFFYLSAPEGIQVDAVMRMFVK